ncbi:DEAD/DEAH box helicase family protein [Paracoccus sp. MC1854]|uniref:BPTD_3080 family restriction endonuclease n=1 Tax=Paracoccus sp. MC1854 TaxID=2760306 RepID=UPI001600FA42|nr:DEAD/DEAH box helicase family protein [Paracoccus sp. MC1854]MBB1492903.1 DEAD/DEAH box helicase family protein [Paracoccus sp. MC1854]
MSFFDSPVLNSPYHPPPRHWELDTGGRPTDRIVEARRSSELMTALPATSATSARTQTSMLFEDTLSTATTDMSPSKIVNELRQELAAWRQQTNPAQWNVTPVTQRLLQHWRSIQADGAQLVRPFFCQLEAAEAAIWLAEVAPQAGRRGKRFLDRIKIANNFAVLPEDVAPPATMPDLMRIAFKLATGAGKTTVMAMLIAWQTLNAVRAPNSRRFSRGFLVVTPGITIRDRLRVLMPNDPESYYASRNLVPHDLLPDMNKAKVVITNYHAFKLRETFDAASGTRKALEGHGAPLDTLETEGQMVQRVMGDLMSLRDVVVINDEAHHCYRARPAAAQPQTLVGEERREAEENSEAARLWISGLEALNRQQGVKVVYDLSATPFFLSGSGWLEGTLFPWVMTDFALMDAIECGIVKLPRVPVADNRADGETVMYRNLWPAIRTRMPGGSRRGAARLDPQKLPLELKVALDALYGHYEKTFREWEKAGVGIPPVFIVVCNNTTSSELVRDYIAGYTRTDDEGHETVEQGHLDLFRNYDDHGQRLERPRTILIDSVALEAGGDVDKAFRDAHATEIEAFRRERARRDTGAGEMTDADILREVMNTVGKAGRLGGQVRCVVSVSMLTEGWDANNVTHIMGLRAFGSRLICEQVIGRALRRLSYDLAPEPDLVTGQRLFRPEYADIMGIDGLNFGEPTVNPPQKPREVIHVHAVSPERDHLEIVFPRVEGFRTDFPQGTLEIDLARMEPYVLDPEKVRAATEVQMQGIVGQAHLLDLRHLEDQRPSATAYDIASYWITQKRRDANQPVDLRLISKAKRIVLDFLKSDRLVCRGGTFPAQLTYWQLKDELCDLFEGLLIDQPGGEPIIRAILDPFARDGSTMGVNFHTTKTSRHAPRPDRSHLNWIITDQDWEAKLAQLLDHHPDVASYAKNHNLGFEVPYTREGEAHRYRPDFLIQLKTPEGEPPTTLVIEVKGFRGHDAPLKAAAMRDRWVPAVNRLGTFGRWGFAELRALHDFRPDLDAAIGALLRTVEPA